MKRIFPLFAAIGFIFILRLSNISVRLSDSNIYFYTAYELLQGKLLYKDIFFTNLPLFPYVSALYLLISNNSILFYYFTSTIEISLISLLIFYILYKKINDVLVPLVASLVYLFSFMVLSTSEHQTGVFLSSLFAVISYYFWEKKKYFIVGIFLALMLLNKAYFIPIVFAFFLTLLLQKTPKKFMNLFLGFCIALLCVLIPFLIFSRNEFIHNIFSYSLSRSPGVSKIDIIWFVIFKDLLFFILLIFNLFNFKKNSFFSLISLFSIVFFLFYSDPYYLYLNFLPPMLCLSLPHFIEFIQHKTPINKMTFYTFIGFFLLYTLSVYYTNYRMLGTFNNLQHLTSAIEKENPAVLYGVNDTTPAIAFLTNTPLINNIVDTNSNIFRKKILSAETLTKEAIRQKAVIVSHGAYYPNYGINEEILDEIFDKKAVLKHCKLFQSHPVYTEGITNRINLFSCKN